MNFFDEFTQHWNYDLFNQCYKHTNAQVIYVLLNDKWLEYYHLIWFRTRVCLQDPIRQRLREQFS